MRAASNKAAQWGLCGRASRPVAAFRAARAARAAGCPVPGRARGHPGPAAAGYRAQKVSGYPGHSAEPGIQAPVRAAVVFPVASRAVAWPGSSYLGWTRGSPPGVPGGGITGVVPGCGFGAGARMPGSTPAGGRTTPPPGGAPELGRLSGPPSGDGMSAPRRSAGTCPAGGGPGGSCCCAGSCRCCAGAGCAETAAQPPRRTPPVSSRPATASSRTLRRRLCGSDATLAVWSRSIVGTRSGWRS